MPSLGGWEVFAILAVVVLLFGAKKLPDLARGSGRALRIFKTEVTALNDDEPHDKKPASIEAVDSTDSHKKPEQG